MKTEHKCLNFEFLSNLGPHMKACLEQARENMKSHRNSQAKHLHWFDQYICNSGNDDGRLTRDLAHGYLDAIAKRNVSTGHLHLCAVYVRGLGVYMASQGIEAYILPWKCTPKVVTGVIYVPSHTEVTTFIDFADDICRSDCDIRLKRTALCFTVLTRLLYTTGLRIGEAVDLRRDEFRAADATLYIRDGKEDRSRIVALSPEIADLLRRFDRNAELLHPNREYFFYNQYGKHLFYSAYRHWFKKNWQACNLSCGVNNTPTPHCLRHAFVVRRIDLWKEEGIDISVELPKLSRMLGHSSVENTLYYYHQLLRTGQAIQHHIDKSSGLGGAVNEII